MLLPSHSLDSYYRSKITSTNGKQRKFSPPANLLTYIISSLFKMTIILVPLMLSHLLVHLPPRPLRSQIALFSMPHLISGINFHLHFVNQFHLFMPTSIHPSVLHFPHPSLFHSFTLNSKHVMQRTVLLSEFCPSACLSVRPSVRCVYCDKTKQRTANILIPHETAITLVF